MKFDPAKVVGFDTETFLFQTGEVIPRLVVCSFAVYDADTGALDVRLLKHDHEGLYGFFFGLLSDPEVHIVGDNTAFDMAVMSRQFPDLIPLIWEAYENGRIHDVALMEKLRHISTFGDIEFLPLPDGSKYRRTFSLGESTKLHLGKDREYQKKGDDAWRLRYSELVDVPLEHWPIEAVEYSKEDASDAFVLYVKLMEECPAEGYGSMNTESFQAAVGYSLFLATAWGVTTDPEHVEVLAAELEKILNPTEMKPLYEAGLLTPAAEPKQKANGTFTKGAAEKKNVKELAVYVERACLTLGVDLKRTAKTQKVSTDADILGQLAHKGDKLMALMARREEHIKLKTTYLPVLRSPVVHFGHNTLVTTGRTSSGGCEAYASTNGQNQPRIGGNLSVRGAYVPRPGHVFFSVDYSTIELCSVAQVTYDLFKRSVHRDRINAGFNLHTFLGSRLAAKKDPQFSAIVAERGLDPDQAYAAFLEWKKSDDERLRKLFKHYRTFAKPTGLGYPGGLGPQKFIDFARSQYDVIVTLEEAVELREWWHETYPEMHPYFEWVSRQGDRHNGGMLAYATPLGMYRANCTFTEMANGRGMQSPSAEGAKGAFFYVSRQCYDASKKSILYGTRPICFIHDEIFGEMPYDQNCHERCLAIAEIMVQSMRNVMPDVTISTEPTLMLRWYKEAEPAYDNKGRLVPWEPKSPPPPCSTSNSAA